MKWLFLNSSLVSGRPLDVVDHQNLDRAFGRFQSEADLVQYSLQRGAGRVGESPVFGGRFGPGRGPWSRTHRYPPLGVYIEESFEAGFVDDRVIGPVLQEAHQV